MTDYTLTISFTENFKAQAASMPLKDIAQVIVEKNGGG